MGPGEEGEGRTEAVPPSLVLSEGGLNCSHCRLPVPSSHTITAITSTATTAMTLSTLSSAKPSPPWTLQLTITTTITINNNSHLRH
ncbi:hypothetical protein E2C01_098776 [Portunus trituberculatus]|uniref:Uncharacterized protein n=1 Tax=Portunus trituberculatus TaxID=210409 RepID=A0A5B7JYM8_PORTR|nr:hypothetical protein [Portunus trituberculatus]